MEESSLKQQRNVQKLCFCPNSHPEGEVMLFKVQYGWAIKVWREKKQKKAILYSWYLLWLI